MDASDWIACVSLLVSAGGVLWTRTATKKLEKRQLELVDRQITEYDERKKKERRADVIAENTKIDRLHRLLVIKNKGAIPAYDIKFIPEGDILDKGPIIWYSFLKDKFPIEILNEKECFSHKYPVYGDPFPRTKVKLVWKDDTGEEYERIQIMDL